MPGASYSIDLDGDGTPDYTGSSGGGQTVYVNCEAVQFSQSLRFAHESLIR